MKNLAVIQQTQIMFTIILTHIWYQVAHFREEVNIWHVINNSTESRALTWKKHTFVAYQELVLQGRIRSYIYSIKCYLTIYSIQPYLSLVTYCTFPIMHSIYKHVYIIITIIYISLLLLLLDLVFLALSLKNMLQ